MTTVAPPSRPSHAPDLSRRLLITREWPYGVCPVHMVTPYHCGGECLKARVDFGHWARALERYFADEPVRHG